jgi:phospholipid/cholesterol/gamma-HCH transport system substrate-binding protein
MATALLPLALAMLALTGCSRVRTLTVRARFADVGDLASHAPVMMADIRVGEVKSITLAGREALVTMAIQPSARVPAGVSARVRRTSLLGERIVDLVVPANLPANAPLLADGANIRDTQIRPDLEDLVRRGTTVLGPIAASEVATLVDEGAKGFGGQGQDLHTLLGNLKEIVHVYAGRSDQIRSVISSLNELNTTLASHASAQGKSVANSARALTVLREEDARLQVAVHALARLSLGARGILDSHADEMNRFFEQMRVILGVLQSQDANLAGFLKYAPLHNRNTQLVEYQEFNQVIQDFVICGFNDNPSDAARDCKGGSG